MEEQLVETWNIHDRIHRYLLALAPKHRNVYQLFAHIHNVRLLWLKSAAPELLNHRGQIGWTLKNTGHALSQKVAYGLWEWGVR